MVHGVNTCWPPPLSQNQFPGTHIFPGHNVPSRNRNRTRYHRVDRQVGSNCILVYTVSGASIVHNTHTGFIIYKHITKLDKSLGLTLTDLQQEYKTWHVLSSYNLHLMCQVLVSFIGVFPLRSTTHQTLLTGSAALKI